VSNEYKLSRRKPSSVVIVIAARNEADNIAEMVAGALQHGDVVVVDDASSDGTGDVAWEAGVDIIRHRERGHIKASYVDGLSWAARHYSCVVQMDAGGSHDPAEIPLLLDALADADMVIGSRFVAGGKVLGQPLWRRILSKAGSALVGRATGMKIADLTGGFKAYKAPLIRQLDEDRILDGLTAKANAFQFELTHAIWERGFTIREVGITYRASRSSLNWGAIREALAIAWKLRWA